MKGIRGHEENSDHASAGADRDGFFDFEVTRNNVLAFVIRAAAFPRRFLRRHGISLLRELDGRNPSTNMSKPYPICCFHINVAEGKYRLYVTIDRASKFAFVKMTRRTSASTSVEPLNAAAPYPIRTILAEDVNRPQGGRDSQFGLLHVPT